MPIAQVAFKFMLCLYLCLTMYFNGSIFLFFYLDDIAQLNAEEKAFVEDPANANLFNDPPSTETKRA